ncbi:lysophospholipase D GDPD1-like [Cimex lectularius]|uniref:GP-PDE domain-containing protein n=1 Tax=Cimex lectularius TaxID=79782 RepID=A0A8I6S730_CIMLE|nr:lysophospholipase D GDPD1-like [Cimex lectularius]
MLDNSVQILIALFGGYVVTSVILLRNPTILYRKKKIKFTCRHISHRGGAGENYENTITAFKRAIALGTDMLEIDCHLTKDNQVVVCHDSNLLRNTGLNKNISELNYSDLPLISTTLPIDFDPGSSFTGSCREDERRIPLLDEVFERFPSIPINIDVKANNDLLIREINRLITNHRREEITVWGSFSNDITYKCYLQNPKVNLLFSLRQVVRLILLFYTGLLPFFPIKETHLEIFQPSMYLKPAWRSHSREREGNFMMTLPTFLVHTMDYLLMSKILFAHLRKRGIQTYVWVLNHENEFKKVYDLGVTGIMTDYPSKLKKFLDDNPDYRCTKDPPQADKEEY